MISLRHYGHFSTVKESKNSVILYSPGSIYIHKVAPRGLYFDDLNLSFFLLGPFPPDLNPLHLTFLNKEVLPNIYLSLGLENYFLEKM